jgi:DNA mismatch repair protein MutL
MTAIQKLPANVVNKIAAGEVVERPASVIKELMENAIDAGASRVDVILEKGGLQAMRVVDNGGGIPADELPLAVTSHATSKIRSDEDLFRVGTLGFRGEALASIGSISRLQIRSRTAEDDCATELQVAGGQVSSAVPCAAPGGTSISVTDLFFNTPVRRKFLRTVQTEAGHATEAFTRLALAYPSIHFTLSSNQRQVYDLPPCDSWRQRIATFFGDELADSLIGVESADEETRLSGYVANPAASRANNRMQYLFLNGRFIRDRSLQHALSEAYRGLLMTGRYPISFLRLEMPPQLVDVNVHPTKMEVKFRDGGRIYNQLLSTIRTRFLNSDLTARLETSAAALGPAGLNTPLPAAAPPATSSAAMPAQRAAVFPDRLPAPAAFSQVPPIPGSTPDPPAPQQQDIPLQAVAVAMASPSHSSDELAGAASSDVASGRAPTAMQALNRYLIAETDDGVIVIDQHALHERILYEQIREKVLAGSLETQKLLVPEPVDLSAAEAAAVLDARPLLEQLGVDVQPFGGASVLISAYPAMLANWNPADLLRMLAEQLTSDAKQPERRDLLDELMHMISCKAAIKAGDRLTADEISALLEQRELAQDAHHCPHGRPTALVFTRDDLDRQFKRT